MDRAARVQAQAAHFGRIYHLSGPAAFARNFLLGRRRPESLLHSFDWLYGHADR
jgi:salicylate hydroxylase